MYFTKFAKKTVATVRFYLKLHCQFFQNKAGVCRIHGKKGLYLFTSGSCGRRTTVNFDQIINTKTLRYLWKWESEMFELPRLKNLCVEETRLLIKLKEQTKKEVQNILEKKKNLVD